MYANQLNSCLEMVAQFHQSFELADQFNLEPTLNNKRINVLRSSMLVEEIGEYQLAIANESDLDIFDALIDLEYFLLGCIVCFAYSEKSLLYSIEECKKIYTNKRLKYSKHTEISLTMLHVVLQLNKALWWEDKVQVFKSIKDLQICINKAIAVDNNHDTFYKGFELVHKANMAKLVDGNPIKTPAGRILKPKGWKAPDLAPFLST